MIVLSIDIKVGLVMRIMQMWCKPAIVAFNDHLLSKISNMKRSCLCRELFPTETTQGMNVLGVATQMSI